MEELMSYSLRCSVFLLCGYGAYRLLLSGEKQAGLNRAALLCIYAACFAGVLLPALPEAPRFEMAALPVVDAGAPVPVGMVDDAGPGLLWLLPCIYIIGMAAVLSHTLFAIIRTAFIVSLGRRSRRDGVTTVLLGRCDVPFSFAGHVVMSEDDMNSHGDVIYAHEAAHLHHAHWLDLLVAQAACALMWYNPTVWLMRRELRSVHENQADDEVLSSGFDAADYQRLLIEKAAGVRLESLANSLNHSNIYKRITMMNKQSNRAGRRMRVLALVPALALAAAVAGSPAVASAIDSVDAAVEAETKGKVKQISRPAQADEAKAGKTAVAPDALPSFPGGEQAMINYLVQNVRYPAEAMEKGIEGGVVVSFAVATDGSIEDVEVVRSVSKELDNEAVRVVKSMPAWTPASKDGKPVKCKFCLPVNFSLSKDKASEKTAEESQVVLDDVRVVAYGSQKQSDGSVSGVKHTESTVLLTQGEGQPTILVDGKPCDDLKKINPSDIASITVRKDSPDYPDGLVEITLKK